MSFFKSEHRKALSILLAVLLILSMMAITTLMPNSLFSMDVSAEATQATPATPGGVDEAPNSGAPAPSATPTPSTVVETTVTASSTTSGTTTTASVSSAVMDQTVSKAIADAAAANGVPRVVIMVEVPAGVTSLKLDLPASSLKTLANAGGSQLSVKSDLASVALDHTALEALVGSATGSTITLDVEPVAASAMSAAQAEAVKDATVVDVSLTSGGAVIHSFNNGSLTLSLAYTLKSGETASDITAYFLTNNGYLAGFPGASFADGQVTFTTNHLSMFVIGAKSLGQTVSFIDVASNAWYYNAVGWGAFGGITTGTGDGSTFSPNDSCTRAQFATFLYRAAGSPSVAGVANQFTDVSETTHASYYNAILWAVQQGVTVGTNDAGTEFSPDQPINRAQAVTMMHRYAQKNGIATATGGTAFTDAPNSGSTAAYYNAILWARANGITNGNSTTANTFGPMDTCTRAEMITFLYRLFNEA